MQINRKFLLAVLFVLVFGGGISGGYFYFSKKSTSPAQKIDAGPLKENPGVDLSFPVKVYYPSEGHLIMEERMVQRQASMTAVAEKAVDEFLKGPSRGEKSDIPAGTKLLRVYSGNDTILYVDFSDEFRRNFQGDALTEFLVLKGLYETIVSNAQGINDVKLIIEGKEIESIGGHISILYPLKNTLLAAGSG